MTRTANTRVAFTETMMELAAADPNVCLVSSDSIKVVRADPFLEKFPDRTFEVGIAEQNAVGLAAGLASCGLVPFFATYAGFITMRACEQVRTFVCYPGLNVKLVGANGGIAAGEREGVTHQFFEDVGIMRTIPGMTIVIPADASQVRHAVRAVAKTPGPAYIRIGSGRDPVVFENDCPFELGKIRVLKEYGNDVALFANGFILPRVLQAADELKTAGIGATVVEVHTLRPLDVSGIASILRKTGAAVTVEDHNINGALGSAVAEVIAEEWPCPLVRIALRDVFPQSGHPDPLLDYYKMGVKDIVEAARRVVDRKA
jgi:transketolase